jgi:hypothetical protein
MRRYVVAGVSAGVMLTVFTLRDYQLVRAQSSVAPEYILKAWRIADGETAAYFWSIEGERSQGPVGTLYKSLASSALREKVGRFPAGTKIRTHLVGAGLPDAGLPREDFENFRAFCAGRQISFETEIDLF